MDAVAAYPPSRSRRIPLLEHVSLIQSKQAENQLVEYKSKAKQDLTERELSQLLEQLEQLEQVK